MLTLSERAKALPSSPIRKLVPFADAARARGVEVYYLNIGQPDLETPPQFFEAIRQANIEVLSYSPSPGLTSYRSKLAKFYTRYGITDLKVEDITITCGGSEALLFAFGACLNPGDELIIPEPFYANYIGFTTSFEGVIKPIPTRVEDGFELPPIATIEAAITPKTKAILLCNPSNPTGKLYNRAALEQLSDIVRRHNLYLIVDEVYRDFVYDGEVFTSILTFPELAEHVIVIDSVSKRYSGCGARVGMFISRNKALQDAAMRFAQARLSPPTLGQIGGEALLDLPDSYYEQVRAKYVARRDLVLRELSGMPGVICPKVSGAFYVMPKLPIDSADRFCQWLLESFSYENHTLLLAPGTGFYATPGGGMQEVRLAYVLAPEKLQHAMTVLREALAAYPGRRA